MFENFFNHLNAILLSNPKLLAHLKLLFALKFALLFILMCIFLYLVYFGDRKKEAIDKAKKDHFIA